MVSKCWAGHVPESTQDRRPCVPPPFSGNLDSKLKVRKCSEIFWKTYIFWQPNSENIAPLSPYSRVDKIQAIIIIICNIDAHMQPEPCSLWLYIYKLHGLPAIEHHLFRSAGPTIWNSLPLSVTSCSLSIHSRNNLRHTCLLQPSPLVELSSMRLWFDDLHLCIYLVVLDFVRA